MPFEKKDERVLNAIIERKRASDMASSIKDGRYDSQKRRLKLCTINRIIYLVGNLSCKKLFMLQNFSDCLGEKQKQIHISVALAKKKKNE